MTGKTKKQILQELEESQKRIQELQQEADRLKNYSFIHESDQLVAGKKHSIKKKRHQNCRRRFPQKMRKK